MVRHFGMLAGAAAATLTLWSGVAWADGTTVGDPGGGAPDLAITLDDGVKEGTPGDELRYKISTTNREDHEVPITLQITLPSGVRFESGDKGAKATGQQITWTTRLPAGKTTETAFTAMLQSAPSDAPAMAATACALTDRQSRPVVCATDIDSVSDQTTTMSLHGLGSAGSYAIGVAIFAVLAGGGWFLLRRRSDG